MVISMNINALYLGTSAANIAQLLKNSQIKKITTETPYSG